MGCREDFFNKTQKTGGRGGFCPCLVELGLNVNFMTGKEAGEGAGSFFNTKTKNVENNDENLIY